MKKLNLLIIGSNFGKYHLKASIKSRKFKNISISSPNIFTKKIPKNIKKFKNFKLAIKSLKIDMITIATKPQIQNEILNYIYSKKKIPKFIFLEKPITNNSIKLIKKFPKKVLILTNFIYSFNEQWNYFKNMINNTKNIDSFEYTWFFNQAYFINKKKTWKIEPSNGGGIINYYLPHAIFNILNIFKNVKFKKIIKKKFYKKILTYLEISFLIKKKISILYISNKSDFNLHKLNVTKKLANDNMTIINKSKKWLSNFKIYSSNKSNSLKSKKKLSFNDGREEVLVAIYSKINHYFSTKYIESNKSLTYKTFELIHKINKKIK